MSFVHKVINKCNCWDSDDYRIIQNNDIFNAYIVVSRNKKGDPLALKTIKKIANGFIESPEIDNNGNCKIDSSGKLITKTIPKMIAKEYTTLESAIADCG